MVFENPHAKKSMKGDSFLTDIFNTSTKFVPAVLGQIKDNNLLSIIDESFKLKDSISKNIDVVKKINKLDKEKKRQEKKQQEEKQQECHKTPKNHK